VLDVVFQLFRRIIANAAHKKTHAYRLSYSHDVGSSFDPDMEDVSLWESELQGLLLYFRRALMDLKYLLDLVPDSHCVTPEDLEQEEIEAYAADYASKEDFSDLCIDDFSAWSDIEDIPMQSSRMSDKAGQSSEDRDMDLS